MAHLRAGESRAYLRARRKQVGAYISNAECHCEKVSDLDLTVLTAPSSSVASFAPFTSAHMGRNINKRALDAAALQLLHLIV